jgi:LAS superfamily LD-carboxypeptidase LdcB
MNADFLKVVALTVLFSTVTACVGSGNIDSTPEPTATLIPAATLPPPIVQITPGLTLSPTSPSASTPAPLAPTPTINPECALFSANTDLLTPIVNRDSGLPPDFEPADLETPHLEFRNAYIVSIRVRQIVLEPLYQLLEAANAQGLQIIAASGYRSYEEQAVAYESWKKEFPDRADTISAKPGHSEHQLGTAIDFSASYMQEEYGQVFHTDFYKKPEGWWLYENSYKYGFTLSYPAWAEQVTGYQWEPWHFRYVGVELATYLFEAKRTLKEYLAGCGVADVSAPR